MEEPRAGALTKAGEGDPNTELATALLPSLYETQVPSEGHLPFVSVCLVCCNPSVKYLQMQELNGYFTSPSL